MNTYKITLTRTNGDKVLSTKNTGLEYPSLEEATHAVTVIQNIFPGSVDSDTQDLTIEKI